MLAPMSSVIVLAIESKPEATKVTPCFVNPVKNVTADNIAPSSSIQYAPRVDSPRYLESIKVVLARTTVVMAEKFAVMSDARASKGWNSLPAV